MDDISEGVGVGEWGDRAQFLHALQICELQFDPFFVAVALIIARDSVIRNCQCFYSGFYHEEIFRNSSFRKKMNVNYSTFNCASFD